VSAGLRYDCNHPIAAAARHHRNGRELVRMASLRARVFGSLVCYRSFNLLGVSAVKVRLRDCLVLAGGIQAKAPAPQLAHQFLYLATMRFHHCSDELRGDARDTAEQ
jgi:hypothetical protein